MRKPDTHIVFPGLVCLVYLTVQDPPQNTGSYRGRHQAALWGAGLAVFVFLGRIVVQCANAETR